MDILERFLRRRQPAQHIRDGGEKQLAFVGQGQAAGMALEERRGNLLLQRTDLAADGRLRQAQRLAGMGEAAGARHRVEDAKFVPIHGQPPFRF